MANQHGLVLTQAVALPLPCFGLPWSCSPCLAWAGSLVCLCSALLGLLLSALLWSSWFCLLSCRACLPCLGLAPWFWRVSFSGRCASPVLVVGSFPPGWACLSLGWLGAPRLVLPGLVCVVASRSTATLPTGSHGHRLCTVSPRSYA